MTPTLSTSPVQANATSSQFQGSPPDVMLSMLLEAEAKSALAHLSALNTPCLLLKGSALAYWAYPFPHDRPCGDVDLLLPSKNQALEFAQRLTSLGYECIFPAGALTSYELMCRRPLFNGDFLELDVHWALSNSPLFAQVFDFEELWAQSIPIPRLGSNARGLCPVHACMHACLHRALNLSIGVQDRHKWLHDIEVLVGQFTEQDWVSLTKLSVGKGIAGVVLVTLVAAAQTFSRVLPRLVVDQLTHAHKLESLDATRLADWKYMQERTYMALPSLRDRVQWFWQRLFPSKAYMGYLYGSGHSYWGLMVIRARRAWGRLRGGF